MTTEETTLGFWNDDDCGQLKGFVCKVDKGLVLITHRQSEFHEFMYWSRKIATIHDLIYEVSLL